MLRLYALGALASLVVAVFAPIKLAAVAFAACGFFTSVLITLLFSGAIHTFRESQGAISGLLITASMRGAIIPPLVGFIADRAGLRIARRFCFTNTRPVSSPTSLRMNFLNWRYQANALIKEGRR